MADPGKNHFEEGDGEDGEDLGLADLPDGGHAEAAIKVDVQLHSVEWLQKFQDS